MCICVYACLYVHVSVCLVRFYVLMCYVFICLLSGVLSFGLSVSLPVCKSVWVYLQINLNACARWERVMVIGGTWMSHDTHMNESWHT